MQTTEDSEQVRAAIRETYGRIATEQPSSGCCGSSDAAGQPLSLHPRLWDIPQRNAAVRRMARIWA